MGIKYTGKLYNLQKESSIVNMNKTAALKWLNHTARMGYIAPCKKRIHA
jgi:hypothetical protein